MSELYDEMVTKKYVDDYIGDIEYRVLTGRLLSEYMRIVERYKGYKQQHEFKKVVFKELMNILIE